MVKVLVAYESKYGNTKRVAEKIVEGMSKVKSVKADVSEIKQVDLGRVPDYDAILVGSPNHFGGPTRGAKKFVDKLGKLDLKGKSVAAFDTYIDKDFEMAMKKLEKKIGEQIPGSKLLAPGLSVKIPGKGMAKGPVSEEELSKSVEFGKKIATQFKA